MKRLLLLATGGTIAGCAENSATLNDYAAGVLGGDALLAVVPHSVSCAPLALRRRAHSLGADLSDDVDTPLTQRVQP